MNRRDTNVGSCPATIFQSPDLLSISIVVCLGTFSLPAGSYCGSWSNWPCRRKSMVRPRGSKLKRSLSAVPMTRKSHGDLTTDIHAETQESRRRRTQTVSLSMRLGLNQPPPRSLAAAVADARPTDMLLQLANSWAWRILGWFYDAFEPSLSFPGSLVLLLKVVERLDQTTDYFRRRLE